MAQNSVVARIQERYAGPNEVLRSFTVDINRRPNPDGGYAIHNGQLVLLKSYKDWTRADLRYVEFADLHSLVVLAAGHHYNELSEITPRAFGTPEAFGAAIMDEWVRGRGQHINKRFLPGYRGDDQATGEARFYPGYGPGTPSDTRPQSERDYERRFERRAPTRPPIDNSDLPAGLIPGGMAFNDLNLTPNARPDRDHDLVSPNVLARAERAVKDLKSVVMAA